MKKATGVTAIAAATIVAVVSMGSCTTEKK